MKKVYLALFAIITAGLLFTSCSKDKTITNQVNQAFSMNSDINPSDWQKSQDGKSATFTLNVGTENISADNFDQEGVLVYLSPVDNSGNIGEFTQLPVSNFNGYDFYVRHAPSELYIDIYETDNSSIVVPTQKYYLKVVFIDAVALGQSSVNTKDYNAVKAAFHLK